MSPCIEAIHTAHTYRVDVVGISVYTDPIHKEWVVWASGHMYRHA